MRLKQELHSKESIVVLLVYLYLGCHTWVGVTRGQQVFAGVSKVQARKCWKMVMQLVEYDRKFIIIITTAIVERVCQPMATSRLCAKTGKKI